MEIFCVVLHQLFFRGQVNNSSDLVRVRYCVQLCFTDLMLLANLHGPVSKNILHKLNTTPKKQTTQIQQNKTTLFQLRLTTLSQETRWAYSALIASPISVKWLAVKTYSEMT